MPPVEPKPEAERDPFFIGWFPMPRVYARFLFPLACVLILMIAVCGAVIAFGQRSPGTGVWDDGTITLTGVVYTEPYAMIRVPSLVSGPPRTILLVDEGKFGAKDRVRPFDGKPVRVRGTPLSREGLSMLELADDEGVVAVDLPEPEQGKLRRPPPKSLGLVTLRGEIVDSKCYLGAMKPGGGRTHKGCAVLCLKGGIPPVFVVREEGEALYLLTNADGSSLSPVYFDFAADNIQLKGQAEFWGDLRVLKVEQRVGP